MTRSAVLRIGKGLSLAVDEFIESKAFIVGQSGRGKSGLLKVLEEGLVRTKRPFVVFDPAGVAWGIRSSKDGKGPGLPILVIGGPHGDVRLDRRAGAETARAIVQANVSAIIDFSEEPKAAYREFLTDFCETLYAINDTSRLVIIDEAKEVVPQRFFGDEARAYAAVERLVRQGRNKGIGVCLVSQRMATVNKDVVTQCGTLFVFGLVGKPDHKALREWVEEWSTEADLKRFLEGLAALKPRECWIWSPQQFSLFQRVYVREFETLHPDRTHLRKMGLLATKPVTTDVPEIVAKLGKQMERLARTKDEKTSIERLKVERDRLKAEVDRLGGAVRDLKSRPLQTIQARPDPAALAQAERRAVERVLRDQARKDSRVRAGLERALAALRALAEGLGGAIPDPGPIRAVPAVVTTASGGGRVSATAGRFPVSVAVESSRGAVVRRPPESWAESGGRVSEAPRDSGDDDDKPLRAGAIRMLRELASRSPMTLTRAQLGTLSGFTPRGGTFGTYFGQLKRKGFLEEDAARNVRVTDEGMAFAGEVPPAPRTHEEIMGQWHRALRAGAARMLDIAVSRYPGAIPKEDLAAESGFEITGGTFGTYLGILRRNHLIHVGQDGIRAADVLFPDA